MACFCVWKVRACVRAYQGGILRSTDESAHLVEGTSHVRVQKPDAILNEHHQPRSTFLCCEGLGDQHLHEGRLPQKHVAMAPTKKTKLHERSLAWTAAMLRTAVASMAPCAQHAKSDMAPILSIESCVCLLLGLSACFLMCCLFRVCLLHVCLWCCCCFYLAWCFGTLSRLVSSHHTPKKCNKKTAQLHARFGTCQGPHSLPGLTVSSAAG